MNESLETFTCPYCEVEQTDLVIDQTCLPSNPGDRTRIFRCKSCDEQLPLVEFDLP